MNSIAILTNQLFSISTGDPTYGGGERYCLSLANHLTSLGFCVDFFQFDYPNSVKKYHGYEVNGILPTTGYSEFSSGTCTKFTEKTKKYTYVIHALPECSSGVVRSDALMISHGIWFDQNQAGYKFRTAEWYEHLTRAFTSPQHIVSVDTNTINVIRALIPGLDDKFHYIPNFVDTNAFYPRKTEHKLRVTFPRRDHPLRGGALVPEIMNNIKSDCEFWWVGGNNPCKDARLKCFIKPFDEMPEVYQQSDIVVIPTLGAEGTSLSILEAMSSGCAVVSTYVGGLPNIIIDGYNGLMVKPAAKDISEAINRLIDDKELREQLISGALETAKRFSLDVWKFRWTKILKDINWI